MKLESRKEALITPQFWSGGHVPARADGDQDPVASLALKLAEKSQTVEGLDHLRRRRMQPSSKSVH
jgi:hypothetical protein